MLRHRKHIRKKTTLNPCTVLTEPKQLVTGEFRQSEFSRNKNCKEVKIYFGETTFSDKTKPEFPTYKTIQHNEFFIQFKQFLNELKIGANRTILLTYFIAHVHAIF
jgi:hypothetical protein